jgi:hypothetical protein
MRFIESADVVFPGIDMLLMTLFYRKMVPVSHFEKLDYGDIGIAAKSLRNYWNIAERAFHSL